MSSPETEALLLDVTHRLALAVLADPFDGSVGVAVGRALVAAHLSEPAIAEESVRTLGADFLPLVLPAHRDSAEHRDRVARLQGGLTAGFAQALRDRTFAQQERIARSAWVARDQVEQALRDSETRFRTLFTGAAVGIGIADTDGRIVDVNQSFADMLGYSVDELRRMRVADLFHADDAPWMGELYAELAEGKRDTARVEKRFHRRDGGVLWTDCAASLIRYDDGRPRYTVAMIEDITERLELQQRLRFQALHDPLTGLPNRTLFFDRLDAIVATAGPDARVGVCFLDLDGFKSVNDTLGHGIGDELLVVVAGRLASSVAGQGHLVARMGGDEFVILVEECTGPDDAVAVAKTALAAIGEPVLIDGQRITVTASVGVVDGPLAGTTSSELMQAADTTLYWAKAEGRGRWALYDRQRGARDLASSALATRLPVALDRGEFVLEYQPIVPLRGGPACAVEALVRWDHPELGRLGPDRFIGLAERTGLIVALGRWVLRQACTDASGWLRRHPGTPLVVSVNLAARQAGDPAIVSTVAEALRDSELPADMLQLELTESALMATAGQPLPSLRQLAALGVRLAIDDFGTGYSNLAYLRRLPIHTLKLAGEFLVGVGVDNALGHRGERIVDALVRLAHALDLTVTAEAVETPEQAARLRALGCDTGQGRWYGSPVPAAEIDAALAGGSLCTGPAYVGGRPAGTEAAGGRPDGTGEAAGRPDGTGEAGGDRRLPDGGSCADAAR